MMSFHRPTCRNQCLAISPVFDNGLCEPRLGNLGVVRDNHLKPALHFLDALSNPTKQTDDPCPIRVAEYVERTFRVHVGGVVNLRRLIEDQETRYWTMM